MKTAWAITPFCEAEALPTRSCDLEPLGQAIGLVVSCGLPALSEEFRRILRVERCGNRAATSSSAPPGSYRRSLGLTSRHSASRASFDPRHFSHITPLGSVPNRSATRASCCPQHQPPRLVRRLTRGSSSSRSPEYRSTRGVVRSTCQERSRRAPPNTSLQRTRYARR